MIGPRVRRHPISLVAALEQEREGTPKQEERQKEGREELDRKARRKAGEKGGPEHGRNLIARGQRWRKGAPGQSQELSDHRILG